MTRLIDAALTVFAVVLAVPSFVLLVECVAALLPARRRGGAAVGSATTPPRMNILVPAHDEEALIAETLAGLLQGFPDAAAIVVIADNCGDRTAAIARAQGATVIERHDPERRGKGYALEFGIEHLAKNPPEVVLIVDADCQVRPGSLQRLAETAASSGRPAQADYLMTPPRDGSAKSAVSALAFLVKNRVRPRGLARLGLPCHLTGTGMAFPWQVLKAAPATGSHLVEDMLMGIQLTEMGFAPLYCVDAEVTSLAPERDEATRGQRRRWEHGHLSMLVRWAPRLILRGLLQRRLHLLSMGLDLLIPPLALFVTVLCAAVVLSSGWALLGGSPGPAATCAASLGAVGAAVFLAWFRFGRHMLKAGQLLSIPVYVLWKIPVYFAWIARGRHGRWERTERGAGPPSATANEAPPAAGTERKTPSN
ncbi:MAG: glycosyltransferase family 2 protein [Bacteroidota bacterium]